MRYKIVDNGSTPFVVETSGNQMKVWNTVLGEDDMPSKLIMDFKYDELFVGDKSRPAKRYGTTLLVKDEYSYILISRVIIRFWPFDIIEEFYAPIFGFQIPYPYAISETNVYLYENSRIICLPKSKFDFTKDVYNQYYGINDFTEPMTGTPLIFQIRIPLFNTGIDEYRTTYDLDKIPSITRKEEIRHSILTNKKKLTNEEKCEFYILEAKNILKMNRNKKTRRHRPADPMTLSLLGWVLGKPPDRVHPAHYYLELANARQKYFNLTPIHILKQS